MGMSFTSNAKLIFATPEDAEIMVEELERCTDKRGSIRIRDGHCDGNVETPVYELESEGCVVSFHSMGYGTYDFSYLKLSARQHCTFIGWVQMITPNQSDDTYCVIHNDKLYDLDLLDQYDFYDQCTPLEEWEDYPKQEDYQTMDDDEVVDDEEAYEEALDEFTQNVVYERLQTEMNELVEGYLEHVEEVAF